MAGESSTGTVAPIESRVSNFTRITAGGGMFKQDSTLMPETAQSTLGVNGATEGS